MPPPFTFDLAPNEFVEFTHGFDQPDSPYSWLWQAFTAVFGVVLVIVSGMALRFHGVRFGHWTNAALFASGVAVVAAATIPPAVRFFRDRWKHMRPVRVVFDETGVHASHSSGETRAHPWTKLVTTQVMHGGVLFDFGNSATYWVPRRAFASARQREEFIAFAMEQRTKSLAVKP